MESEWMTIETAPKDGTEILAFDGEERLICFWSSFVINGEDRGSWYAKFDNSNEWGGNRPIAWMPLPEPPK